MKWSVCLVALLFLAPALAQNGNSGASGDEPSGDHSDEARNETTRGESGPQSERNHSDRPDQGSRASSSASSRQGDEAPERDVHRISSEVRDFTGRYVSLQFENGTFTYSVGNTSWFDVALSNATLQKQGNQWKLTSSEGRFVITDTPAGHISYTGHELNISFAGEVREQNQNVILLQQGDKIAFVSQHAERQSFFSFHIKEAVPARPALDDAIAARKVAAKVRLDVDSEGDQVETYDDVSITVERPAQATRDTPYKVVIGAELDSGRTIVLDVNRLVLPGPDLELRYFDVNDDGTETEVVFRQADSLADILEPTDDAGQPEYWVVEDENGLQVMVSIPHWSTHAVTLASIGSFVQPQVWLGAAVGALVSVLAGVAMLRPKREE